MSAQASRLPMGPVHPGRGVLAFAGRRTSQSAKMLHLVDFTRRAGITTVSTAGRHRPNGGQRRPTPIGRGVTRTPGDRQPRPHRQQDLTVYRRRLQAPPGPQHRPRNGNEQRQGAPDEWSSVHDGRRARQDTRVRPSHEVRQPRLPQGRTSCVTGHLPDDHGILVVRGQRSLGRPGLRSRPRPHSAAARRPGVRLPRRTAACRHPARRHVPHRQHLLEAGQARRNSALHRGRRRLPDHRRPTGRRGEVDPDHHQPTAVHGRARRRTRARVRPDLRWAGAASEGAASA